MWVHVGTASVKEMVFVSDKMQTFLHPQYASMSMQYTAIFRGCKNVHIQMKNFAIFLIFAQNIDCGYTLERLSEAVLKSTHNLFFRAKIRKQCIPL